MKDLIIIGAGGFAREVLWLVEEINRTEAQWNVLGFLDEDEKSHGCLLNGKMVLGGLDWFNSYEGEIYAVCAVGNSLVKKKLVSSLNGRGIKYPVLIHPSVIRSEYVEFGDGCIVCAGNIFTTNIEVGSHVSFHPGCTIGHDVEVFDYATVLPGVNISGNVELGEGCNIGTNATIIQGIKIGAWSVVGAGSVLVKDIPPKCTAVGVPAKPIKFHEE